MRCQECNYDLTGVEGDLCPECGAGAHPMKLLKPDDAFETLVRVLGTYFAAMALAGIGTIAVDAYFRQRLNLQFVRTAAPMVPSVVIGVYLLFFAPQIRRLCYRSLRPRVYAPRAVFHLVVGLVGVWIASRGLADIGRNALAELLASRPNLTFVKIATQLPRVVIGGALVMGAAWLSRIWRD